MKYVDFIKEKIIKHPNLLKKLLKLITYTPFINNIRKRRNLIIDNGCLMLKCYIDIHGKGNKIIIGKFVSLRKTSIRIWGDDNTVVFGDRCNVIEGEIHVEDSKNIIDIGKNTIISGKTHLACIEGTSIHIGEACLFSSEIVIRTGDSHSILNMEGTRINKSQSVAISDRVWVGNKTIILKGVYINADCIVGTGAVVTKGVYESNSILGGVPAEVIFRNIKWQAQRK